MVIWKHWNSNDIHSMHENVVNMYKFIHQIASLIVFYLQWIVKWQIWEFPMSATNSVVAQTMCIAMSKFHSSLDTIVVWNEWINHQPNMWHIVHSIMGTFSMYLLVQCETYCSQGLVSHFMSLIKMIFLIIIIIVTANYAQK